MNNGDFIAVEGSASNQQSLRILVRFLRSLTLLRRAFPLVFVLMLTSTAAPQFFLWLIGRYSQCPNQSNCSAYLPFLGQTFALTPRFLCIIALVATILR